MWRKRLILSVIVLAFARVEISAFHDAAFANSLAVKLTGRSIEWPCESTKNIYLTSGRYVPKNVIPLRAQIYKSDAIVVLPRLRQGVPITLGRIELKKGVCYSTIKPFPCWSLQEEGNCESLQNVVDVFLDSQNVLWVLDIGIVNTLDQPVKRCDPKVLAMNARTGEVLKVIDLSDIVLPETRMQYLVVDYSPNGEAFVYIADAGTQAIIVADVTNNKKQRVLLPSSVVQGCTKPDVLYILLVKQSDGSSVLYFTYLCAKRIYSIKSEFLRDGEGSGAVVDVGRKPNNLLMVFLGTDRGSSIFFRYKGQGDIFLWNTETCFKSTNFLEVQRSGECRLATQVVPGFKNFMWALESNFHDYVSNKVGCIGASAILHPVVKDCDN